MPPSARRSPLRLVPHESRCPWPASALLCLAFISFCCTVHPRAGRRPSTPLPDARCPLHRCVCPFSPPTLAAYDAPFGTTCTPARSASGRKRWSRDSERRDVGHDQRFGDANRVAEDARRAPPHANYADAGVLQLVPPRSNTRPCPCVLDRHSQTCVPCCRSTPHWPSMRAHARRFQRAGP